MQRLSAPERTREELRALMNGDLGTAAGRGDLVRLALRLIVAETLEGEVSDALGRERYERGEGEKPGYRNGYRTGKVKMAEGAVEYAAPQVRDTPEPFISSVRAEAAELLRVSEQTFRRPTPSSATHNTLRRAGVDLSQEISCVQEKRQVGNDNCVSHCTLKLQIPESSCVRTSFQGAPTAPTRSSMDQMHRPPQPSLHFSKARMQPGVGVFLVSRL